MQQELAGDGVLSLVLMSQSENTTGWAYFAKNEYRENGQGFPACLLYAFGGTGIP